MILSLQEQLDLVAHVNWLALDKKFSEEVAEVLAHRPKNTELFDRLLSLRWMSYCKSN